MRRVPLVLTAVAVLGLCGTAPAALDTSNVYTDGNGTTWTDTVTLTDQTLSAAVEYCVNGRVLHGGELQFEYVYQITSLGTAPLTQFQLTMKSSNEAVDIGSHQIDPGDIPPTEQDFNPKPPAEPDYAYWSFANLDLVAPETSYAMTYWSVNEPLLWLGSVINDSYTASGMLASPSNVIPEPVTIGLLTVGLLPLLRRRKR